MLQLLAFLTILSAQEKVAAAKNTPAARDQAIAAGVVGKDLTKLTRDSTTAFNRVTRSDEQLAKLEQQLDITERWTADSAEYVNVTEFIQRRKYLKAVDTLEALVVQRLFELTKMNQSGTGTLMYSVAI